MRRFKPFLIAVVVLALVALTAACSGDDDSATTIADYYEDGVTETTEASATTEAMEFAPLAERERDGTEGEEGGVGTDAEEAITATDPADLGRLIVYTASISVEVDDVITAGAEAQAAVAGLGGVLFGQETTTGEFPRSVLTIKVPPANFQEALQRLSGVGKLLGQSVYADDVTERVVDLQSQITTSEASVERLRGFLANATDLETVAKLETELLNRETSLEILRGRLRTLDDQVAMATIVLALTEPVPDVPEPSIELIQTGYDGHDGGAGCPGADELQIDEGSAYTVCVTVTNDGDTPLTDIEVSDRGLKIDSDEFILIAGSLDTPLAPEGTLIFVFEGEGDPDWSGTNPAVRATAVDEAGDQIRVEINRSLERLRLRVDPDDSLPGFTDGLGKAWEALQRIIGVGVVLAGALIPFLWVPILAIAAIWFMRRRRSNGEEVTTGNADSPAGDGS
ncbi:MAG: DUF4349 domain-containing protein [Actinobacteria bacterium]|nr:DUF4349 domain-containing protein [Actinomycetota bacterium]